MAEEFYRLRQKSTGLYLSGTRTIAPINKDGTVSKAPRSLWGKRGRVIPYFTDNVSPVTIDGLINEIRRVMRWSKIELDQQDLELEITTTMPDPDSEQKIEDIISEIGQELLAEKLKGN